LNGVRVLQALIYAGILTVGAENVSPPVVAPRAVNASPTIDASRAVNASPTIDASRAVDASSAVDIGEFRGRVVYLDFWASWCAPCRQSFPWMQAMKDAYESRGLTVLAVNLDQHRGDAERFLAQFHPSFDVRFDPQGTVAERFKVQGMPTGLLIDRHGVVRFTHIGFRPVDAAAYENQLREILAEK
jgi:cytochrome c biogenesis protein CcmG/thiol:disulfide interchange protein DsbE